MSLEPDLERAPAVERIRLGQLLRFLLFLLLVVGGFLFLRFGPYAESLTPEALVESLRQLSELRWAPAVFVGAGIVLTSCGMPATPVIVAGAAVFGTVYGGFLAYVGMIGGAAIGYTLAKTLARDLAIRVGGATLRKIEDRLEGWGFWSLIRLRFMPVPFLITNAATALVGVPPIPYLLSTAIGLIPSTALVSYFSGALLSTAGDRAGAFRDLLFATALLLLASFLPGRIIAWRERSR